MSSSDNLADTRNKIKNKSKGGQNSNLHFNPNIFDPENASGAKISQENNHELN
jgi:hypothetical protein